MLSRDEKSRIKDDLLEEGLLDNELANIIVQQEKELEEERNITKKLIKENPDLLRFISV